MSFETLREKRCPPSPPPVNCTGATGWITKDSTRIAGQRWGALAEQERHGDGWGAPAPFLPSSLSPSLPTAMVSIAPQSKWMVGKDYYTVFNHHTVERFYAYFICISLNHVSKGPLRAKRSTKLGRQEGKKKRTLWCLSSNGLVPWCVFCFSKIIMTWKPLKLDTTLDSSNSCRAVYF